MQKQEALDLLKEIVTRQAASPNWLSLKEKEPDKYEISIKGNYNKEMIDVIVQARGVAVKESYGSLTIC